MSQEIVKLDVNNAIPTDNSNNVQKEFKDEYYQDNKICVSETSINISYTELNKYNRNDEIKKYEIPSVGYIKTDLPFKVNETVSNNVKVKDGISSADIQIVFCNGLLFCNHCQEVYQDYCTKCRVLVHILNKRPSHNIYNRVRELPKYMLETRESFGDLGIYSLKVIPENVTFGPFTGLNSTGLSLKIKGGRLVVRDDQLGHLNWMQYVNPARNINEQNLFPFRYEDRLYYCSTRSIHEGEELLVYFGEEYVDNLFENVEMDFVPITKEDVDKVFACTFCCLGFSSKEYLADHKAVCYSEISELLSVEELVQCPFCKIYLGEKEYLDHHMDYCCERNARLASPDVHKLEVEGRSSIRNKTKSQKCAIYKCTQCKFRTMYNVDFRNHINKHYEVKMYKSGICGRRYKTRDSLKVHVEKIHVYNEGRDVEKYPTCDYFNKNMKERSSHSLDGGKQCKCSKCKSQTRDKCDLKSFTKTKHLKQNYYKCAECEYQTKYKSHLEVHVKTKHLKQKDYKCAECEYQTNYKQTLIIHLKGKHLKQNDFKCSECEFNTNNKGNLQMHIKTKHLKQSDYKCAECEYQTNYKQSLKNHVKTKHLNQKDYKCGDCQFKTAWKSSLELHVKARHLKENDYICAQCEYKTSNKSCLQLHIKTKHLKENDYKCEECEFKTAWKSSLELHVKAKHLKENDYICAQCEYKTSNKSCLQVHIKTKHLKEKIINAESVNSRRPGSQV